MSGGTLSTPGLGVSWGASPGHAGSTELWLQLGLEHCHQFPAEDAVTRIPPPCQ